MEGKMKFNIGDKIWYAKYERYTTEKVTCPDCCGNKYLTIIMGDETKINIPCQSCLHRDEYSYEDYSRGFIEVYVGKPKVEQLIITGIDCQGDEIEYKMKTSSCSCYIATEKQIFNNEADAIIKGQGLADEYLIEQKNNIENRKHNDKRTWAWHVYYHRKAIEGAKKNIEYHTKKLGIAIVKNKEAKKAT